MVRWKKGKHQTKSVQYTVLHAPFTPLWTSLLACSRRKKGERAHTDDREDHLRCKHWYYIGKMDWRNESRQRSSTRFPLYHNLSSSCPHTLSKFLSHTICMLYPPVLSSTNALTTVLLFVVIPRSFFCIRIPSDLAIPAWGVETAPSSTSSSDDTVEQVRIWEREIKKEVKRWTDRKTEGQKGIESQIDWEIENEEGIDVKRVTEHNYLSWGWWIWKNFSWEKQKKKKREGDVCQG